MLIKTTDSKASALAELEHLRQHSHNTATQQKAIDKEIRILKSGIKGESDAAYLIDFSFKNSKNNAIIHDLRLEINGRIAQIDHLLINRSLMVFVLESKHFNSGIKINDNGEFLYWNDYKKTYEGMPSPLAQNERHIAVLKDAFNSLKMPTRLGIRLTPSFVPYVLVSASARIDRPQKFDTSEVIKSDVLENTIMRKFDKLGIMDTFSAAARMVSPETLEDIALQLSALHTPTNINYKAKFGITDNPTEKPATPPIPEPTKNQQLLCRKCNSSNIGIQYGKFGYYFKCLDCDGNTPIKVTCEKEGCKARLRKEGHKFFKECTSCNSSSLFFTNP